MTELLDPTELQRYQLRQGKLRPTDDGEFVRYDAVVHLLDSQLGDVRRLLSRAAEIERECAGP